MGKVNKDVCIWCAACVATAWNLFKIEEDGKAFCYKQPEPNTPEETSFKNAKDNCPVGAIED
jgi:ferredoxin